MKNFPFFNFNDFHNWRLYEIKGQTDGIIIILEIFCCFATRNKKKSFWISFTVVHEWINIFIRKQSDEHRQIKCEYFFSVRFPFVSMILNAFANYILRKCVGCIFIWSIHFIFFKHCYEMKLRWMFDVRQFAACSQPMRLFLSNQSMLIEYTSHIFSTQWRYIFSIAVGDVRGRVLFTSCNGIFNILVLYPIWMWEFNISFWEYYVKCM